MTQVFVYGTLRPCQANHDLVADAVATQVRGRLDGHALRATPTAAFPYGVVAAGQAVIGDVLVLRPGAEQAALRDLDALEGFHPHRPAWSHYVRVERAITVTADSTCGPAGTVLQAWVYLAGPRIDVDHLRLITGGDWTRRAELTRQISRAGRWS